MRSLKIENRAEDHDPGGLRIIEVGCLQGVIAPWGVVEAFVRMALLVKMANAATPHNSLD